MDDSNKNILEVYLFYIVFGADIQDAEWGKDDVNKNSLYEMASVTGRAAEDPLTLRKPQARPKIATKLEQHTCRPEGSGDDQGCGSGKFSPDPDPIGTTLAM